jgi:hypothetical protein
MSMPAGALARLMPWPQIGRIWRVELAPVTPGVARGGHPWFEIGVPALAAAGPGVRDTPA